MQTETETLETIHAAGGNYKCTMCGKSGVKLWRRYSYIAIDKFCCVCACIDQGVEDNIGDDGKRPTEEGRTDQIKLMVPAVPIKGKDGYWPYTLVPAEDCTWWRGLPTR